jgi:hypothetical protein
MDLMPLVTSGRARFLDNPKIVSEGSSLERRTFPTGCDRIDPGVGHDDHINAMAIAMTVADAKKGPIKFSQAALLRFKQPLAVNSTFGRPRVFLGRGHEL